jgi:hypothetical protein
MTAEPAGFQFTDEPPPAAEGMLIVRIPKGVARKRQIFTVYSRQLSFPDYFGWNWDAFYDCLGDLSGVDDEIHEVVVVHCDLPFTKSATQQKIYLSLLKDCLKLRATWDPKVTVIFPLRVRDAVLRIVNQAESE